MNKYVDVLLPLAMKGTLTYGVPSHLQSLLKVGARVVVPLGKRKIYTGIAVRLHSTAPQEDIQIKDILDIEDVQPIVYLHQLKFWKWISDYYLCTAGEVMKAALPSGLKLESETTITRNDDFDGDTLDEKEWEIWQALKDKSLRIADLQKSVKGNILRIVSGMAEKEAVLVDEILTRNFKPKTIPYVRLTEAYFDEQRLNRFFGTLKRSQKQESTLLAYLDMSECAAALTLHNRSLLKDVSKKQLLSHPNASDTALKGLKDKGVLEIYDVETERFKTQVQVEGIGQRALDEEQQRAYNEILNAWDNRDVCLLHGVTSSGKTEIYIHLIEQALASGKQVLYLLPEIALTTQITTRLGRIFGDKMGVYHSKFPNTERVEVWRRQISDHPFPIILGVRSSLFLPFDNLGLIIVDEEHETSYKQQDPAPRYNARDAAIVLAMSHGAKVLLGTATPSLESYHNARSGKYGLVELTKRHGDVLMPEIIIEDVKELRRKKLMKTPFAPRLIDEVRSAIANKQQVILFQNRRGYSPVLECRTCGWTPRCQACDVSLTYHQSIGKLICHYCGASYDIPMACPNCNDTELRDMGYGTEKIEAAVKACFPEARTARMDLDTTRGRTAYERIINDFQHGKTDILIGTQMVTKGLDFDRVSVVGILNADQSLNVPDFRAHERTFQMMSQVAGRAGRRGKRGLVILQTRQPDEPVITQVKENNYQALFENQMEEREFFHYPPIYHIINIYLKHRDEHVVAEAAKQLASMLQPYFSGDILGPDRPAVARVQRLYIRKIMVKIAPNLNTRSVRRTLLAARDNLLVYDYYKTVNVYFDADPL